MAELIREIEAFVAEHDLSERQFGELVLNDKKFVPQLREGRDLRLSTVEKVRAFMRDWRPDAPESAAA